MRCCLSTIHKHMALRDGAPQEGETLDCEYEEGNRQMIFHNGAWEWNRELKDVGATSPQPGTAEQA